MRIIFIAFFCFRGLVYGQPSRTSILGEVIGMLHLPVKLLMEGITHLLS